MLLAVPRSSVLGPKAGNWKLGLLYLLGLR
eukprot:COSAG01_NODE_71737_length_255_cov_0.596154_1_plen_29_part_01